MLFINETFDINKNREINYEHYKECIIERGDYLYLRDSQGWIYINQPLANIAKEKNNITKKTLKT